MNLKPCLLGLALLIPAAGAAPKPAEPRGLDKIGHILVVYLENHSFDSLYGLFPGADGLDQAKPEHTLQTDAEGKAYASLPRVMAGQDRPDPRFPENLPNRPFLIDQYVPPEEKIPDPTHSFYRHRQQLNGRALDRFAAVSNVGGLVMGHYDGSKLPLWQYAKRYTLADHFFQAGFGGSFFNHQMLACACAPRYEDAPEELKAKLDEQGRLIKEGPVTPDGYAVGTLFPAGGPRPADADPKRLLPPQTAATLGGRLDEKGVDWAWYSGGWADAEAGRPAPSFQFHHQPYAYYARYAPGSQERARHLKDEADLLEGIARGALPPVAFYKPLGELNEHPGYAALLDGERHVAAILEKLEQSPLWKDSVVVVAYDEYGGFWDHVPPPPGNRFGPGSRVPAIVISPYARRGHVDHTVYDTTSILKLIENRFGLEPLTERDGRAESLERALEF